MSAFFIKLAMGIAGEIALRLAKPEVIVDIAAKWLSKAAKKTDTNIDDLIADALQRAKK